jgi:hypothetical protein
MGMHLILETDPETRLPRPFPDTDSKDFLAVMFGLDNELLEGLGVDLAPFYGVPAEYIDEQEMRAAWGDEADSMIAYVRRINEAAWGPPARFIACLQQLAERLEQSDRKLPAEVLAAADPAGLREGYFQQGWFYRDVIGCMAAMKAAADRGVTRVRFFTYG